MIDHDEAGSMEKKKQRRLLLISPEKSPQTPLYKEGLIKSGAKPPFIKGRI